MSVALIGLALASGIGVLTLLTWMRPEPERKDPEGVRLIVDGITLTQRTVVEPLIGFGTARARRSAWLSAEVAGQIVELPGSLRVGDGVKRGQLLARIDERTFQAQVDRMAGLLAADEAQLGLLTVEEANTRRLLAIAESELAIAEREYERVLGLFESGASNRRELDLARQALDAARRAAQTLENQIDLLPQRRAAVEASRAANAAQLAMARLELERCRVVAPFDGRIEVVDTELGERVSAGQRLFSLLDPRWIEAPIELPAARRGHVREGATVTLLMESDSEARWSGRIRRIGPSVDLGTRTFPVFVEVDNSEQSRELLPGTFVRARIAGPTYSDVVLAPRSALERDTAYVYFEGQAARRTIRIERTLLDRAVVSGLEPGEVLITSNLDSLYDGSPVKLNPVEEPPLGDLLNGFAAENSRASRGVDEHGS